MDNKVINLNKVRVYREINSKDQYNVVVGTEHKVDGVSLVIAKRPGKQGLVRLPTDSLEEVV